MVKNKKQAITTLAVLLLLLSCSSNESDNLQHPLIGVWHFDDITANDKSFSEIMTGPEILKKMKDARHSFLTLKNNGHFEVVFYGAPEGGYKTGTYEILSDSLVQIQVDVNVF